MQTDATLLDVTCCICLHTLLHDVACCWELLCVVVQSLKPFQLLAPCKWMYWELMRPFAHSLKAMSTACHSVFHPFFPCLLPFHVILSRCFKAMLLFGI